ncbi:DUF2312 domain-containing protein [Rhizobium ruizarguesonis]|uniref:DUF2312 domain-containing protein n=1 Tax=Rhizobium ruizarguesonis TaxID=2081791 RepID=UPI001030414A|nr:DUF2312 domain-containing protein [Rhizobium ruizarguesonis]TBF08696.1 DUF2312 domain-containing protein [Rhizobium ruizarguesonis]
MTADGQIKSFFQRWETLEAEKQQVADLMKDLFAEAKGFGYDTKALRAAFRLKAKQDLDSLADAEFEAIVDTYMSALNAPTVQARDARMRTRENIEEFDPITGEFVDDTNAPERPSHNDEPSPEEGPQAEASPAGTGAGMLAGREGRHEGEATSVGLPTNSQSDDDAIAAVNGKAGLANVADVEPSSSGQFDPTEDRKEDHSLDGNAGANTGGRHVTAQAHRAATAGALVQVAPATKPLRPHCRNPGERCAGYGSTHCGSCLRAAREPEVAA